MKRIYLGALLVVGLVLTGCGNNAALSSVPESNQLTELSPAEVRSGLSVQAAGDHVPLPGLSGMVITLEPRGSTTTDSEGNKLYRFLNHTDGLGRVDITDLSDEAARQSSSWRVSDGMAGSFNNTCFSFESVDRPGEYLRHSNYRVRLEANDGSELFSSDATFCARSPLGGSVEGSVGEFDGLVLSFESFNFPGNYLKRVTDRFSNVPPFPTVYDDELFIAKEENFTFPESANFVFAASWNIYKGLSDGS